MNKSTAKILAKQIARESQEIIKDAREQIMPVPETSQEKPKAPDPSVNPAPSGDVRKDSSFMQAYKHELEEIRRDNLFKNLQEKIANGEDIPLTDYINELSIEQMQVLKAMRESVKIQKENLAQSQKPDSVTQIVSKKARGMVGMFKKRNQQHVELRQPPSS